MRTLWRAAAAFTARAADGVEIVGVRWWVNSAVQIADTQGTEDQDGRPDTSVPQHDPLFDVSTRQHRGAGFLEGEPDLR